MRILFLSPRQCWPPLSGAKLREYYFARALGQQADLTHVHFTEPGAAPLSRADLPFCRDVIPVPKPRAYTPWKIVRGLIGRWPLPVLNYTSSEMSAALFHAAYGQRYDLVHLDSIHMAAYLPLLAEAMGATTHIVYNWHNIESELMRRYHAGAGSPVRRLYSAFTAHRMERLERSVLRSAFGHVVCSEREREQLREMAPAARIAVVPNGVDTQYFADAEVPAASRNRIVFVGLMNYHSNIEAAIAFTREVWPRLRSRLPGCSLTLVGATPDPAVLALREVAGVEVTGTVPDVRPYYREALAAIVPLRTGGGTRLKILEAMAAGVPVVSTAFGAEGLDVAPGENILLADPMDPDAWVRQLAGLAESESWRRQLTASARQLVRERYEWTILGESLCRTYREWLESPA
ncbi:MAG: glycosyltransferase [Bryobacteraceae bacterium]|jgi:glycosyltransferase involved in cell wall biosynthesis